MRVQRAKRRIQLQDWAQQIAACNASGQTIKQWCHENGINLKTYYNRLNRVREEMLDALEPKQEMMQNRNPSTPNGLIPKGWTSCELVSPENKNEVTIRSELTIEIGNSRIHVPAGVNDELLSTVCRVLVSLC